MLSCEISSPFISASSYYLSFFAFGVLGLCLFPFFFLGFGVLALALFVLVMFFITSFGFLLAFFGFVPFVLFSVWFPCFPLVFVFTSVNFVFVISSFWPGDFCLGVHVSILFELFVFSSYECLTQFPM